MELNEFKGVFDRIECARRRVVEVLNDISGKTGSAAILTKDDMENATAVLDELYSAQESALVRLGETVGSKEHAEKLLPVLCACDDSAFAELVKFLTITSDLPDYRSAISDFQKIVLSSDRLHEEFDVIIGLINKAVESDKELERVKETLRAELRKRGQMEIYAGLLEGAYRFGVRVDELPVNSSEATDGETSASGDEVPVEPEPVTDKEVVNDEISGGEPVAADEAKTQEAVEWFCTKSQAKIKKMTGDFMEQGQSGWHITAKGRQRLKLLMDIFYFGIISYETACRELGSESVEWLYNHGYIATAVIGGIKVCCLSKPAVAVMNSDIMFKLGLFDSKIKSMIDMAKGGEAEALRIFSAGETVAAFSHKGTVEERGFDGKNEYLSVCVKFSDDFGLKLYCRWGDGECDVAEGLNADGGVAVVVKSSPVFDESGALAGVRIVSSKGKTFDVGLGDVSDEFFEFIDELADDAYFNGMREAYEYEKKLQDVKIATVNDDGTVELKAVGEAKDEPEIADEKISEKETDEPVQSNTEGKEPVIEPAADEHKEPVAVAFDEQTEPDEKENISNEKADDENAPIAEEAENDENKVIGDLLYKNPETDEKEFYELALKLIAEGREHDALLLLGCLSYENDGYKCAFEHLRYITGASEWGGFDPSYFSKLQDLTFSDVLNIIPHFEQSLRLASRLVYLAFFGKNDWSVQQYRYPNADGAASAELETACKELITVLGGLDIQNGGYTENDISAATDAQAKFKEYQAVAADLINRPYTGRFDFRLKTPFLKDKILCPCLKIVKDNDAKQYDFCAQMMTAFNRDDGTPDEVKLNDYLDAIWRDVNAGDKKDGEPLVEPARGQAYEYLAARIKLIDDWLDLVLTGNNAETTKIKSRGKITAAANKIVDAESDDFSSSIVKLTAKRIETFLSGKKENRAKTEFELVSTNEFILSEGKIVGIEKFAKMPGLEPWKSALRHIMSPRYSENEVLSFTEGDFGEEWLGNEAMRKCVCDVIGKEYEPIFGAAQIKLRAEQIDKEFVSRIEKESLYARIDEADKEELFEEKELIKQFYIDDFGELGKFFKFCGLLEKQVDNIVDRKTKEFSSQSEELKKAHPGAPIIKDIEKNTDDKNFVVAEEYISRLQSGVTELDEEELAQSDCNVEVEQFLDIYDEIYNIANRNKMGKFSSWANAEYKKRKKSDATASDEREAEKYFAAWDNKNDIGELFKQLGFEVATVRKNDGYLSITVTPPSKNRSSFAHPVSAFGTACKEINVLVFNSGNKADRVNEEVEKLNPRGKATVAVFYAALTKAQREEILRKFKDTSKENSFLLLDYVLGFYLSLVGKGNRLTSLLKCTVPYTGYKLYADDTEVLPEMFTGRENERRKITDMNDGTTLVYGGRRLGKTALFKRACEVENDPANGKYSVYVSVEKSDGDGENFFVDKVANGLIRQNLIPKAKYQSNKEICDKLRERLGRSDIKTLYLFIDEVNNYFKKLNENNDTSPLVPFDELRKNMPGKFKCVFAGLHHVALYSRLNSNNSVMGQMSMPLVIKPFSPLEIRRIIEYPFSYLGIKIEPQLIALLASRANYYPGSIQLICQRIVETVLNNRKLSPPYTVNEKLLEEVCGAGDINDEIKRKLKLTLESDSPNKKDSAYSAIAYLFIYLLNEHKYSGDGYNAEFVLNQAKKLNIACLRDLDAEAVDTLLGELTDMSILRRIKSKGYKFRKMSFADLIEPNKEAVEDYLLSLEDGE